jgi:hypothetical protein
MAMDVLRHCRKVQRTSLILARTLIKTKVSAGPKEEL